ncbi:MAG: hypothetical protein LBQ28_00900 [Prevotellaceae bacterium]|jgi:hypothetical protein|nr:hypothetical protein [Prevotellaceae bacterium]
MAIKKCIICGNCRSLVHGAAQGKCPVCDGIYTGKEVGVPVTVEVQMKSRRPERAEIDKLKNAPFARKSASKSEINTAVGYILMGIIVSPLMLLFGLWVINGFKGPGVLVFGYGAVIAAPILFIALVIGGIYMFVRDPRKKTVKDVFNWIWSESYKEALFNVNDKNKGYEYAYGSVIRCVPSVLSNRISKDILAAYLSKIQNSFKTIIDEKFDTSCKWKDGSPVDAWNSRWDEPLITAIGENEIESGLKAATMNITVKRVLKQGVSNDDAYEIDVAYLSVKINGYYIKNGNYWIPYDLMPEIIEEKETNNIK